MQEPTDQTFELYLEDDRYTIPTLRLIEARDVTNARVEAERIVSESAHHLSGELRLGGERLGEVAPARPRDAG